MSLARRHALRFGGMLVTHSTGQPLVVPGMHLHRFIARPLFARIAVILALVSLSPLVRAQGMVRDDFEGPEPVLRSTGGDVRHQVELHQRVQQGAHAGRWCEHVRISGGGGTAVYYSYPIAPARVINEWQASIWMRADRPGLQIVARVVLPRTKHPTSGEPLTTLIRGSSYKQAGTWQPVEIGNLPRALEWQVRVLRSQFGPQVDPREAYVDLLLLNVYGGPGTTNVWVDDLEVSGGVAPTGVNVEGATAGRVSTASALGRGSDIHGDAAPLLADGHPAGAGPGGMPNVEFKARLLVGGEPFFPRLIEHRGEPLSRLQALGFNGVWLSNPPTPELLAEAARLRMWIVAPPPPAVQLRPPEGRQPTEIGAAFDPVLAWNLGQGLSARDLEPARHWAELVQAADPRRRPIVTAPAGDLQNFTRPPFKVLLAERETLGTSLELSQYSAWLAERTRLARAGAPLWVTIPSQPSPQLVEQMRLVSGTAVAVPNWQESQLRTMVHAALAARARGICFSSHARLDSDDAATRVRAAMLELLNLELQLIERWPAAGNFAVTADSSHPHTTGAVIETDRSRLMLPIHAPPGGQFAIGTQTAAHIAFTVAGVPEGDNAYELSLVSLRPLRSTRVTGGMRVVLDDVSRDSLVVFTHDPLVIRTLKAQLDKFHRRAAFLARELAAGQLAQLDATSGRLAQLGRAVPGAQEARAAAVANLRQYEALAASGDLPRAYREARHALQIIRHTERLLWEQAAAGPAVPLADPLSAAPATLPEHYLLARQLASAPRSANRLSEGSCENLSAMLAAGWKHFQHKQEAREGIASGVVTGVDLTPRAAHSGTAGLLIRATAADESRKSVAVETPPVWVTTAPVAVERGDLVQIQAWVRIDAPITASVDGLVILDTLSGKPLALRVSKTDGWQQVTLIRAAPRTGLLAVTFALAGLGEAAIDDVSIQIIERGKPPLQQVQR